MRVDSTKVVLGVVLTVSWIMSIVATVAWGMPRWGVLPLSLLIGYAAGDTHRVLRNRRQRRNRP